MKKRWKTITSVVLSAALLCPLLSATSGAEEVVERMPFPDVFQGKNMYITAKPYEIKNNSEGWILATELPSRGIALPGAICSEGRVAIFKEQKLKDEQGYYTGTTALINFTDTDGNIIIDHSAYNYDEMIPSFGRGGGRFSDGLSMFYDAKTGKYGYMDTQGRIVIPPRYDISNHFRDGIAEVTVYDEENDEGTEYYIDKAGNAITVPDHLSEPTGEGYGNGLLPTYGWLRDGSGNAEDFWGYIDTQGKTAITIYRDAADKNGYSRDEYLGFCNESYFQDGYAVLEDLRGGRKYPAYVVIDTKGNEVCTLDAEPPYYVQVGGFHGRAGKYIGVEYLESTGGQVGRDIRTAVVDMSTGREVANFPVPENKNDRYTKLEHLGSSVMLTIEENYSKIDGGISVSNGYEVRELDGSMLIPNLNEKFTLDPSHRGSYINSYTYIDQEIINGLGLLQVGGVNPAFTGSNFDDVSYTKLYILEAHEGTYTGSGLVYNAVTGQMSGSGTPQPDGNTPSGWAAEQVNAAISAGIVPDTLQSGYQQPITRAEFCALAVELYETVKGTEITQRTTFTDTDDVNVQKMGALEVVTGVGGGRFEPNGTLTREQAATMLARLAAAMGSPMTAQTPAFADNASISTWAFDAVGQVLGGGVMSGGSNNMFLPKESYTRE